LRKLFSILLISLSASHLQACSTNPATGSPQFTALMSEEREATLGAQEHENIIQQFGLYEDPELNRYVRSIGAKVTSDTERPDVTYKFFVIDSPIVNAFALPGGYIYLSRGLIALANNEAQMAAVLAHEAGHITGRHSAERYSQSVVTGLGAGILGAVLGEPGVADALGLGANLYLSSYSRGQESEADTLGLRYMSQAGYDPDQMAAFLSNLQAQSGLDAQLAGKNTQPSVNYFSTHPATKDRVLKTVSEAQAYNTKNIINRDRYLQEINGMTYGDSATQGFVRDDRNFYHPKIGFTFSAPEGFRVINQPNQVIATNVTQSNRNGATIVFDMAKRGQGQGVNGYLKNSWLKDKRDLIVENITVNGMPAATASFEGRVNNLPVTLRVMAIEFAPDRFARFQVAIPQNASAELQKDLRNASYSFRRLSASEKNSIRPYRLKIVTAKAGDTIASLARQMPFKDKPVERFQVLNGLLPDEALVAGRAYKTIIK